jgi:hypothetical protein
MCPLVAECPDSRPASIERRAIVGVGLLGVGWLGAATAPESLSARASQARRLRVRMRVTPGRTKLERRIALPSSSRASAR